MKILKNGVYKWWQIGILKLTMLAFGIVIGATWPEIFIPYIEYLLVIGVVLALYLLIVWVRK